MKSLLSLPTLLFAVILSSIACSCNSDEDNSTSKVWNQYADWRESNNDFFARQRDSLDADGKPFYRVLFPQWNPAAEVLIHYFNDREETAGNLQPMLTSTCEVIYHVSLMNGTPVDSSYTQTTYGRAIARFRPQSTIQGFAIALMDMHVGDSVQVLIPYTLGYGADTKRGFPPFSTLVMNMRLTNIPFYEIPAN